MMQTANSTVDTLLPHLFRQEYAKLTAVLSRYFGLEHIEVAEDIASETFLKATEHWPVHGIPDTPAAWLYTVAKNKAKDYLKRHQLFESRIREAISQGETVHTPPFEFTEERIADSQLSMLFAVCDPANPPQVQVCLALQILCAFSVEEIANAFLSNKETIKKRLQRGRDHLRRGDFRLNELPESALHERLDMVLKTLYLLFNEGYFSQNEDAFIRKDLCSEAMRLALLLAESKLTGKHQASALLALMCFQSSRLDARTDDTGQAVLYEDQDRSLWDQFLMEKGNYYLFKAFETKAVSTYHVQAGIAYWHTTSGVEKWPHILQLYNQLVVLEYSPATAINRAFAVAQVHGFDRAIAEAEKLNLAGNNHYHGLMGYLYSPVHPERALFHYREALTSARSAVEKKVLAGKIAQLTAP
jgi:RNA polymerase sigma factor (sigma-70 family)